MENTQKIDDFYLALRNVSEDNDGNLSVVVLRYLSEISEYELRRRIVASLSDKEKVQFKVLKGLVFPASESNKLKDLNGNQLCLLLLNSVTVGNSRENFSSPGHLGLIEYLLLNEQKYDFIILNVLHRYSLIDDEKYKYYSELSGYPIMSSEIEEEKFVGSLSNLTVCFTETIEKSLEFLKTPYNPYHDELVVQLIDIMKNLSTSGTAFSLIRLIDDLIRDLFNGKSIIEVVDTLAIRPDLYLLIKHLYYEWHFIIKEKMCEIYASIVDGECEHILFAIYAFDEIKEKRIDIINAWLEKGRNDLLDVYLVPLLDDSLVSSDIEKVRKLDKQYSLKMKSKTKGRSIKPVDGKK